jgi:fatty-acyl-CoA synthase
MAGGGSCGSSIGGCDRGKLPLRLGKTQRVSALHAIAEMPRSHIGKLLKTELRELVS